MTGLWVTFLCHLHLQLFPGCLHLHLHLYLQMVVGGQWWAMNIFTSKLWRNRLRVTFGCPFGWYRLQLCPGCLQLQLHFCICICARLWVFKWSMVNERDRSRVTFIFCLFAIFLLLSPLHQQTAVDGQLVNTCNCKMYKMYIDLSHFLFHLVLCRLGDEKYHL